MSTCTAEETVRASEIIEPKASEIVAPEANEFFHKNESLHVVDLGRPLQGTYVGYNRGIHILVSDKRIVFLRGCQDLNEKIWALDESIHEWWMNNGLSSWRYYIEHTITYRGKILTRDKSKVRKYVTEVQADVYVDDKKVRSVLASSLPKFKPFHKEQK